jgi:hypothetical protein
MICVLQALISLRINGTTVRGHDNLELTSHIDADVVFLGSSRCLAHFNPNFFDSVYHLRSLNMGMDGHGEISMARIRLSTYLLTNKAPRVAFFTFDPFTTAGSSTQNRNFIHKDDFARYAFLPTKQDIRIVDYFGFGPCERYVPLYALFKYHLLSDALFLNNRDNWVQYGYERHLEDWDTTVYRISDTTKRAYFKASQADTIARSLDSLNNLCRQNNIQLLCIQTPVYKIIYDETSFSLTKQICERLGIPFIDVDSEDIRDDFYSFYNSYHMNHNGVAKLNAFLIQDSLFNSYMRK